MPDVDPEQLFRAVVEPVLAARRRMRGRGHRWHPYRDGGATRMSWAMILKVQRPLYSTDPRQPWLVYSRGRAVRFEVPAADVPAEVAGALGDRLKVFVEVPAVHGAEVSLAGARRVEDQAW